MHHGSDTDSQDQSAVSVPASSSAFSSVSGQRQSTSSSSRTERRPGRPSPKGVGTRVSTGSSNSGRGGCEGVSLECVLKRIKDSISRPEDSERIRTDRLTYLIAALMMLSFVVIASVSQWIPPTHPVQLTIWVGGGVCLLVLVLTFLRAKDSVIGFIVLGTWSGVTSNVAVMDGLTEVGGLLIGVSIGIVFICFHRWNWVPAAVAATIAVVSVVTMLLLEHYDVVEFPRLDYRIKICGTLSSLITIAAEMYIIGILNKRVADAEAQHERDQLELHSTKQFFSQMVHDVRSPLNVVVNAVDYLTSNEKLSPSGQSYVAAVKGECSHLEDLVTALLDTMRLQFKQKLVVTPEMFNVRRLLEKTTESMDMYAKLRCGEDSYVKLFYDTSQFSHVVGDRVKLSQCVRNLVTNAIKYSSETKAEVRICVMWNEVEDAVKKDTKLDLESGEGGDAGRNGGDVKGPPTQRRCLVIEVIDNGRGIGNRMKKTLFRAFQREDGNIGSVEGTGLGLHHCWCLVQAMDGEIQLDEQRTVLGQGSCFVLRLPMDVIARNDMRQYRQRTKNESRGNRRFSLSYSCGQPSPAQSVCQQSGDAISVGDIGVEGDVPSDSRLRRLSAIAVPLSDGADARKMSSENPLVPSADEAEPRGAEVPPVTSTDTTDEDSLGRSLAVSISERPRAAGGTFDHVVVSPAKVVHGSNDDADHPVSGDEPTALAPKTIVCVDDNRVNLMVLEMLLGQFKDHLLYTEGAEEHGSQRHFATHTLTSVEAMLSYVRRNRNDIACILLDLHFGAECLNGEDGCRQLRQEHGFDIPVIAITGDVDSGLVKRLIDPAVGFSAVVSKPVEKRILLKTLQVTNVLV